MTTISSLLIDCLRTFNDLISRQDLADCKTEVTISLWKDELGRLRIWASNIGAHQSGQSSLDYRLKDASHITVQAVKLLQRLRRTLKDLEEVLTEVDSDKDDGDSLRDEGESEGTEMEQIYRGLIDTINCLFQLSMIIRRPIQHDRLLGTRKVDTIIFEPYDRTHVAQKYPQLEQVVVDRLGSAISRRRAMLKYHERHHAKLGEGIEDIVDEHKDALSSKLSDTIATGFDESHIRFDDTASNSGVSQTSYAPSIWESSEKLTVPPPPRESANEEPFECPYCFYIITIKNKNSWAHHVFRDLMPYTCVFPECPSPNQLYGSRREWFSHLSSAHMSKVMGNECPLHCGATSLSASILEKHVGRHLEELALFAIPRPTPDNEDEDSGVTSSPTKVERLGQTGHPNPENQTIFSDEDSYDSDDAEADVSDRWKARAETGSALGQDVDLYQPHYDTEERAYMAAQKEMFAAEERDQMNMGMGRTEEEFAERMNEAAWRTTNSAATDKIQ
ncbi:hypothetical protein H2202_006157 [Exophiala xenobiotica]|nr:hypothetical protein H2202_006157 [Exophiala xenobiotica]KAK5212474.1 hypothetical protein LTR41_001420 [Exophiala xenobiotica]KAK5224256.1 hypothetical protein LTR47_009867 [Exophiala xenobiotica]KAK5247174.1 hypothetical protein LTS06_007623 [Exophiala xenobiotica]KAK5317426.1 hypothetical protein LTR93_008637 [Exophiala xenobiotica]